MNDSIMQIKHTQSLPKMPAENDPDKHTQDRDVGHILSHSDNRAIYRRITAICAQLTTLLEQRFETDESDIALMVQFLHHACTQYATLSEATLSADTKAISPFTRLQQKLNLTELESDILVIAGMAQQHEGFADIFRTLHPSNEPYPTPAILAQILNLDGVSRDVLQLTLSTSMLIKLGFIRLTKNVPVMIASLQISPNDWSALKHGKISLHTDTLVFAEACDAGLHDWLQHLPVRQAIHCLTHHLPALLLVQADHPEAGVNRALVMARSAGRNAVIYRWNGTDTAQHNDALTRQCLLTDTLAVILIDSDRDNKHLCLGSLAQIQDSVILCTSTGINVLDRFDIVLDIPVQRLPVNALTNMWQRVYPQMFDYANRFANRFPLEPERAKSMVRAYESLSDDSDQDHSYEAAVKFFRTQSMGALPDGVKRIVPSVDWGELILPESQQATLRQAVSRLQTQYKVLDEWKFLHNRRGARGIRLLFSGLPGTGKTLSAEVMANSLQVDLLAIDLAALVSKWIGETEKNLSKVFSYAEQSQAVLFFDEADSIFGKRTEVNDAHDRYANLETSYLLARLEAFEGLAILATNYRNNIDAAFIRRLDYIIEFREPTTSDRERLWRCHVPQTAPVDDDVNFAQLASLYPMVGGEIRNAALAAAFIAAEQNHQTITHAHFINAIAKEYEKSGKAIRQVSTL